MSRRLRDDQGATLVEFAAVVGLLALLVFGIADMSRLVAANSAVATASRESARYGSSVGLSDDGVSRFVDCSEIRAAGTGFDLAVDLEVTHFTIEYDHGPGTGVFLTCPVGGPDPDPGLISDGDRVVVTVTREFEFVTPLIGRFFGAETVSSVDRRTIQSP